MVLAIQNDPTDPPLMVGEWLAEAGLAVQVIHACFGEQVPAVVPAGVHGLLPLGGVMGATDDDIAPWLVAERALLADATARGVPVLGLCLGAQLLATATGGRVELGPVTEIGVVVLMPAMVTALDVFTVETPAFVTSTKLKGLGVVSAGTVVALKSAATPPMVSVAIVAVAGVAELVWRTATIWPLVTV